MNQFQANGVGKIPTSLKIKYFFELLTKIDLKYLDNNLKSLYN